MTSKSRTDQPLPQSAVSSPHVWVIDRGNPQTGS